MQSESRGWVYNGRLGAGHTGLRGFMLLLQGDG